MGSHETLALKLRKGTKGGGGLMVKISKYDIRSRYISTLPNLVSLRLLITPGTSIYAERLRWIFNVFLFIKKRRCNHATVLGGSTVAPRRISTIPAYGTLRVISQIEETVNCLHFENKSSLAIIGGFTGG